MFRIGKPTLKLDARYVSDKRMEVFTKRILRKINAREHFMHQFKLPYYIGDGHEYARAIGNLLGSEWHVSYERDRRTILLSTLWMDVQPNTIMGLPADGNVKEFPNDSDLYKAWYYTW